MTEPREWWIPNEKFISQGPAPVMGSGCISLVEKSVYEAEKARSARLVAALRWYAGQGNALHHAARLMDNASLAQKVLAEYDKEST